MESSKFENMTRTFGRSLTRRTAVREMMAGAMAVIAGGVLMTHDADAKRRRKKGRKGKGRKGKKNTQTQRFLAPGELCTSNSQCNGAQGYICAVASNAGNGDRTCSGATGAVCGAPNADGDATPPFCAAGFQCVGGICQPVP